MDPEVQGSPFAVIEKIEGPTAPEPKPVPEPQKGHCRPGDDSQSCRERDRMIMGNGETQSPGAVVRRSIMSITSR